LTVLRRLSSRIGRSVFTLPLTAIAALLVVWVTESAHIESTQSLQGLGERAIARAHIQTLWRVLVDAENGQRGYLLTGRKEYLKPYEDAQAVIVESMGWLRAYYRSDPQAGPLIDEIVIRARVKQAELAATIQDHEMGRIDRWVARLETDDGRVQMEAIRESSEKLLSLESARVAQNRQAVFDTLSLSRIAVDVLTLVGLAAFLFFVRQISVLDAQQREAARALQAERDLLESEVGTRTAELTELARHLQTAQEQERSHLARELHDELGALLTAAKFDSARLKRSIGSLTPEVAERLRHLDTTINQGIALKRRIIEDLRPSSLSNLGLQAALEIQAREFAERSGLSVDIDLSPVELSDEAKITVYRLVQEALTNIAKYAAATSVIVSLHTEGERVWVSVRDNGKGFDTKRIERSTHGLVGMRYRVEAVGGVLRVESRPGNGTTISAWLPALPVATVAASQSPAADHEPAPSAAAAAPAPAPTPVPAPATSAASAPDSIV